MYHQNKGEKQNRKKQKNSNDNNTAPSTFDNSPNNNNNNENNKNNNSSEISNPNNSTSQINSEAPPKDSDSFSNNIISDTNKNDNNIISITKKANPTTTYTESNASITIRAVYEKETTTSRSQTLPIRDKQLWTFGSTQEEKRRWLIFEDLWKRGYWLTNGSKFGGDFLVYPGNITITRQ